jgi:hypothetical protein
MKLHSVQLARTVWTFDTAEMNPRGKNIFSDLVPTLTDTFDFKKSPEEGGDFSKGMVFTLGSFTNRNNDEIQVGMTLWSDGIAADTYSTTVDADEFLDQVVKLLPGLGYTFEPAMIRRKGHLSQLFVGCEKHLPVLNPRLTEFAKKLSSASSDEALELAAIEFWPDPILTQKTANFSFQRKTGVAFAENRYWSQAGLSTDMHLEMLEELEAILSQD